MSRFRNLRRAVGGGAGAPATLLTAELHYNMDDGFWRAGFGDDGAGNATSAKKVFKDDFLYNLPAGTNGKLLGFVAGLPSWVDPPSSGGTYTAGDGLTLTASEFAVDYTELAAGLVLTNYAPKANPTFSGTVTIPTATAGDNTTKAASTAFVQASLVAFAPKASPTFTGTPTAPTPTAADNSTKLATTGFVQAAINALVNGAGGALDTIKELADALGNDPNFATTLTNALTGKLAKASNLSDLPDVPAARTSLGLGTMAIQNANAVAITGGTIENVILDAGVA